jgi:hypothetical protein
MSEGQYETNEGGGIKDRADMRSKVHWIAKDGVLAVSSIGP